MVFIDIEKAYHNVSRQVMWDGLVNRGVLGRYIEIIGDMYYGVK